MQVKRYIAVLPIIIVLLLSSCRKNNVDLEDRYERVLLPPADYELFWADEFDGKKLDTEKWSYRALGPRRDGFNSREAISIDTVGKYLEIKTFARNDSAFSGMIGTMNKFETTYGYFECRAKVEKINSGYWPAFWLQSSMFGKSLNPAKDGMEIDIFEFHSGNPYILENAVHWNGYGVNHQSLNNRVPYKNRFDDDQFHHYALEWTPDSMRFFYDGLHIWTVKEPISHRDQYIILSTEVDNAQSFINTNPNGTKFIVDFVRVYKRKEKSQNE